MYIKLDEETLDILKRLKEINFTDYELEGDMLPADSVVPLIRDMMIEIDKRNERIEDMQQERAEDRYEDILIGE